MRPPPGLPEDRREPREAEPEHAVRPRGVACAHTKTCRPRSAWPGHRCPPRSRIERGASFEGPDAWPVPLVALGGRAGSLVPAVRHEDADRAELGIDDGGDDETPYRLADILRISNGRDRVTYGLSYRSPGGGEGIRTPGLCRARAALYRAELHPQESVSLAKGPDGPDYAPAISPAVRTTTWTRSPSPTEPRPLNVGRAQPPMLSTT